MWNRDNTVQDVSNSSLTKFFSYNTIKNDDLSRKMENVIDEQLWCQMSREEYQCKQNLIFTLVLLLRFSWRNLTKNVVSHPPLFSFSFLLVKKILFYVFFECCCVKTCLAFVFFSLWNRMENSFERNIFLFFSCLSVRFD